MKAILLEEVADRTGQSYRYRLVNLLEAVFIWEGISTHSGCLTIDPATSGVYFLLSSPATWAHEQMGGGLDVDSN